ncbi:MAG TPA: alpha/beta hydrolase [Pyrinomonadaceae bacterium]
MTHIGARLIVAIALVGLALVCGLRWFERAITFHPERLTAAEQRLPLPAGAENVWFTSADGVRLHGWYFATTNPPDAGTIIYFHGNGGNIRNVGWLAQSLAKRGFNVLLFDYRGYGVSDETAADEAGLYLDGEAALSYVVNEKDASPNRIVLYGQSLGTAVATQTATRCMCGALILESGFSSASSLASRVLPWLPRWLHFLGKNRFESARKLRGISAPVLISHGDPDLTIPTDEGRALFAAANEPKKLLIFPGAGHSVFGSAGPGYLDQLEEFIRSALPKPAIELR